MKPNERQLKVLELARDAGYVRLSSATHAQRCGLTVRALSKVAGVCRRQRWLRLGPDGKLLLTDAGREFVPDRPPRRNDEGWGW